MQEQEIKKKKDTNCNINKQAVKKGDTIITFAQKDENQPRAVMIM